MGEDIEHYNKKRPAGTARRRRGGRGILLLLSALIISGFIGAGLHGQYQKNHPDNTNLAAEKKIVTNESRLISRIARTVGASVVSVNVDITTGGVVEDGFGLFGGSTPE